ncbi:hypothetical protein V6M85_06345 [Sulfolobus tengchongensis]|uniref:Uncharacterized protein n=1 Tax=Sulfolobus tengchongensis TaxID=207809 RepID=A0AAX4L5X3_9CREN
MTEMEFVDFTNKIDIIEDVVKKRQDFKDRIGRGEKADFEIMDSIQVGDYSFGFVKTKYGYSAYELIIKKSNEEYHIIFAQEKNGFVVALNVFKDIVKEGDKKSATVESYLMKGNTVTKVLSGRYEIKGNVMQQILKNYEPEKVEIKRVG